MEIKTVEMYYMPEKLGYRDLHIDQGIARIDLELMEDIDIYFYQVSKEVANSTGYNSDRKPYKEIYNRYLKTKYKSV